MSFNDSDITNGLGAVTYTVWINITHSGDDYEFFMNFASDAHAWMRYDADNLYYGRMYINGGEYDVKALAEPYFIKQLAVCSF